MWVWLARGHMRGTHFLLTVCVVLPDNQNCPFIILLEPSSCPFPIGITGVAGGGSVCHR